MKAKLHFMVALFVLLNIALGHLTRASEPEPVVLQNNKILAAFDARTGALVKLENKSTGWKISGRPKLGTPFRLLVPLEGRRANFVLGEKQKASSIEKLTKNSISIKWENPVSESGKVLLIVITARVSLEDSTLVFEAEINNKSANTIETVDYPYLGELNAPSESTPMSARTMWYDNLQGDEIYPAFGNTKGYWGLVNPIKIYDSNRTPFCLIQTPEEGIYVEQHDISQPYLLQYTFEQHPGVLSTMSNAVPQAQDIAGMPVHLEFRTCHFIFAHPNSISRLSPVHLSLYRGDWHSGVDIYKNWRKSWYKEADIPEWTKQVHSWQQIQVNSTEQDFRVPYKDLLSFGEDCKKHGVGAIQVVGWNKGGQDAGNPLLDTDPGLGNWKDLKEAISKIQALGVKVVLFGKFPWADKSTKWYKEELYKYAATDPYGEPYENPGCSYITPVQISGINNHRFAVMDFLSPEYRSIAVKEFSKVLDLGAAGFLYDEVPTHNPAYYNFSSGHGYNPPGYLYAGDKPLAEQLHEAAIGHKDFLFAAEGPQDYLMQYYPLSYFRINESSTPVCRYIDSKVPLMVGVTGFDNREMINHCMLYRYIISYEPFYFKGRLDDFPLTLEYGKKIDALRTKYKEYLWDSEFMDTKGAAVTSDDKYRFPYFTTRSADGLTGGSAPLDGSYRYSVFVTSKGKRAVVIANQGPKKTIKVGVSIPNAGKLITVTPEAQVEKPFSGTIQIPARSLAVVIEQ